MQDALGQVASDRCRVSTKGAAVAGLGPCLFARVSTNGLQRFITEGGGKGNVF